jgi:hypothetical protein
MAIHGVSGVTMVPSLPPCSCIYPCRNTALGSYCGISTSMGNALVCDRKTVVASNLAYQFKFTY